MLLLKHPISFSKMLRLLIHCLPFIKSNKKNQCYNCTPIKIPLGTQLMYTPDLSFLFHIITHTKNDLFLLINDDIQNSLHLMF